MPIQRPATPLPIKRLLRQEAGFGCCICGIPILQYHHIIPYHQEEHFRVEDMMALCPTHHDMMTKEAMREGKQREYKARPFNIVRGRASGLLQIEHDVCALELGSVLVVNEGPFLVISGEPIVSLSLGDRNNLELSIRLYDATGNIALEIEKNDWVSGDPLPWDIEADWQKLILRYRKGEIALDLDAKTYPMTLHGNFWKDGQQVQVDADGIGFKNSNVAVDGITLVGWAFSMSPGALSIGPPPGASHREGMLIYETHPVRRLEQALSAWRSLKTKRMGVVAD